MREDGDDRNEADGQAPDHLGGGQLTPLEFKESCKAEGCTFEVVSRHPKLGRKLIAQHEQERHPSTPVRYTVNRRPSD